MSYIGHISDKQSIISAKEERRGTSGESITGNNYSSESERRDNNEKCPVFEWPRWVGNKICSKLTRVLSSQTDKSEPFRALNA